MDGQTEGQGPNGSWEFRPGDTITPGSTPQPAVINDSQNSTPPAEVLPVTTPAITEPQPVVASFSAQPEAEQFQQPLPHNPVQQYIDGDEESIRWTASEFVAHHKTPVWFIVLTLVTIALVGLVFFLTHDIFSSAIIGIGAIGFGIYAGRTPKEVEYGLTPSGLSIGNRYYQLADFRSFSVISDGAFRSVMLNPLKRFGINITVYYDPEDEDIILDILSASLPHEERNPDPLDQLMRRIRF